MGTEKEYTYEAVSATEPLQHTAHTLEKGQLWRQYYIAGVASVGIATTGCAMGWTSPVYVKLRDANLTDSPLPAPITVVDEAWIGSLLTVGATVGPFAAGYAAYKIGRKGGLLASSLCMLLGWLLVAYATSLSYLYAGRVFWGLSTGMMFTLAPMYCAEIATDDVRGALGSYLEMFGTLGFVIMYSVGPFVSYNIISLVGALFVVIFAISFCFMPESPIYYLTKTDRERAAKSLMIIRGRSRAGVEAELDKMTIDVSITLANTAKFSDIFRGSNLKALYICCTLLFFQQLSGITAILFYLTTIFKAAGADIDPAIATIIVGFVQLGGSILGPFFADRMGRRALLLISCTGCGLGLALLGTYFLLEHAGSALTASLGFLPLLSVVLYITSYPPGLGAMTWALVGETFSIEVKNSASPLVTAFNWLVSIATTRFFGPFSVAVGIHTTFFIFAGACVGGFVFTYLVVPETKGKSYQEVQAMLAGKSLKPVKV